MAGKSTDVRIRDISFDYEDFHYRAPLKFGGVAIDRVTLLNVHSVVEGASGQTARGFGSMPLGNVWSFPSKVLGYDDTLRAMKSLTERFAKITAECKDKAHPSDLAWSLEPEYLKAADEVSRQLGLPEPIPKLCTLVVASAFDAAVHDAFGKLHGLNCYHTCGPEFMSHDLSFYLGPEFKGEHLDHYLLKEPKPRIPLYHLIGALVPIEESDIENLINDGLPETLPEWIRFNGLTHLKIKLNGDNLDWDVERVVHVDRVASETQRQRRVDKWCYSL